MSQFSYSRVDCYKSCPFRYKLRYIDKLSCFPEIENPANALLIGTAMHTGIDKGVDAAIKEYKSNFYTSSDRIEEECMKFKHLIPLVQQVLPEGELTFEHKLENEDFIGYIDLLVKKSTGTYAIYDFKYSNNVSTYKKSAQLHLYKYFFERDNPDKVVDELGFIFVPKTSIRQKKDETVLTFRQRIQSELNKLKVKVEMIEYDPLKVVEYFLSIKHVLEATDYPKQITRLCDYCAYNKKCLLGYDYMLLSEIIKQEPQQRDKVKMWIYGEPYTGKTNFAAQFPHPLILNTNANASNLLGGRIDLADFETNEQFAWEKFKEIVAALKTENTEIETVVIDLVEELYEYCRRWCCIKLLGISHESDNNFKAWDTVSNEFINQLKDLVSLDKNIIFISHEDKSRDYIPLNEEKRTLIVPNIKERFANKIAAMVDLTGRMSIDTNGDRKVSFLKRDNIFVGSRFDMSEKEFFPCVKKILAFYNQECKIVQEVQADELANKDEENLKTKRRRRLATAAE